MRKIDDVIKSIFRSEPNVFGQDLMTSYEKLINMRMFKSVRKKSVRDQNAPERKLFCARNRLFTLLVWTSHRALVRKQLLDYLFSLLELWLSKLPMHSW